MVHPRVELDHFLILDDLQLNCVQCDGNLWVIHFQALILLVVVLLFLQFQHELILLAEEELLTSALDVLAIDTFR